MPDGAPTLSPEMALAYLAELTVDVRAAAVRRVGSGELCAGDPGLAEGEDGVLTEAGHTYALSVALGPLAEPRLVRGDLRRILEDLESTGSPDH